MTVRPVRALATVLAAAVLAACSGGSDDAIVLRSVPPTTAGPAVPASTADPATSTPGATPVVSGRPAASADVAVAIDASSPGREISPLILGMSSSLSGAQLRAAGVTLNSWGGNPSTRYNYDLGNAWNGAADSEFRNTNYGSTAKDAAGDFVRDDLAIGVQTRLAIPTLGWVAKDDDTSNCSFPSGGGCLSAEQVGRCGAPKHAPADPNTANVQSTPALVGAWLERLAAGGATPQFVAMDNEPELWGDTHFDVHPSCPTYEEILDKYLEYAPVAKAALPQAAVTAPALCCWFDYWHVAPGPADGSKADFLGWFLDNVRRHDEAAGTRSLDYLDVHFYPQTGVFNDDDRPETNAKRLRSTRALWDDGYVDESWINDRIRFIPRMLDTIAGHYPGTKLFISEWNFGNDKKINGALAIADTLGIYGREGVDAAAYWRNPDEGSPGWYAFMMYGNYDGAGTRFGGVTVPADPSDLVRVGSYAALDRDAGVLRVMLVNRDPSTALSVSLDVKGTSVGATAPRYTYSPLDLTRIVPDQVATNTAIELPASSVTTIELPLG